MGLRTFRCVHDARMTPGHGPAHGAARPGFIA